MVRPGKGKLSFTNAAEVILREKGTPMHVKDIVNECLKRKLIQTSGKTPESTLGAALYHENKRKSEKGGKLRFKKVGPSTWALVK